MEVILLDCPINGYEPGDTVSGVVEYNIASNQETIYDVQLFFDGNLFIRPSKYRFEAHRSAVTLIEKSHILFDGPFTLRRQQLTWHFTFLLPYTATTEGVSFPMPPSMDHQFREGLQICVRYSISATLRLGSSPVSARQKTEVLHVRPSAELTTYESCSSTLLFPVLEIPTICEPPLPRLRFWSIPSWSGTEPEGPKQTFHFEMTLPSMLFLEQRESILCSLKTIAGGETGQENERFSITALELILQSRLTWESHLQNVQRVATVTRRPDTEIFTDGNPVSLFEKLGLQDFSKDGLMTAPLNSYDSVIPEVTQAFTISVRVVVEHTRSGRRFQLRGSLPIVVHEKTVTESIPPLYSCSGQINGSPPPSYT